MGMSVTPTRTLFRIRSPEGNLFSLCGEDFSGFVSEPFPGVITAATIIITAIITTTATAILIIITITTTTIGNTPIKVKLFPFGEIFQKVSASISL